MNCLKLMPIQVVYIRIFIVNSPDMTLLTYLLFMFSGLMNVDMRRKRKIKDETYYMYVCFAESMEVAVCLNVTESVSYILCNILAISSINKNNGSELRVLRLTI